MRDLTQWLSDWLAGGGGRIGQILIHQKAGGWELRHADDAGLADLATHHRAEAARHLANLDAAGAFRPLKTAPDLIRGWRLVLDDPGEVRRAIDYFYPAMVGVAEAFRRSALPPVPLRATLARQTGMYRITQKITDEQARGMIDRVCAGCLKRRLWEIAGPNPEPIPFTREELPLLCHEACNLLVAEARKVVKSAPQPEGGVP